MARPAGYSSDEYSDDDDLKLSGISDPPKKFRIREENFLPEERLVTAAMQDDIEEVKKIISEGVDLDYKSDRNCNWTALMHASSQGNAELVKLLLENGASTKVHHQLVTALICVCDSVKRDENALVECLNHLVQYDADYNTSDWHKMNGLMYAAKCMHEKVILRLLDLGCNIEESDIGGWTPIFYAVDVGCINIVQILKDAGADIKRLDRRGRNLHDLAMTKYHKHIAEIVNTEEKVVDVDDIIESSRTYKRMSTFEYVLSELPDPKKNRFHGFKNDAIRWISSLGMGTLVKLLIEKDIQLGQLLVMDDNELEKFGVTFSYERKKIRYCVQKFHERHWGKNVMNTNLNEKEDIDLITVAQIILNMIRQMHILSSTTYFWKIHDGHILTRNKKQHIDKALYNIKYLRKEIDIMLLVAKEIEEEDNIVPSDLIIPDKKNSFPNYKKYAFASLVVGYIVYRGFDSLKQHLY